MLGSVLAIGCALAIACAVLCSVVAWRARHELAAGPTIAVAALGLALATLPDLISGVHGAELAHAAAYQTTGGALLTAGFGGLAVGIADRRFRFRRRHLLVLADPALLAVTIAVDPPAGPKPTPPMLVHLMLSFCFTAAVAIFVLRRNRSGRLSWHRAALAWTATLAPVVCGGGAAIAKVQGASGTLLALGATTATMLFLGWLTWGALALLPVARSQVVNAIPDAVVVFDNEQMVVTANPAARRIMRQLRPAEEWLSGLPAADLMPGLPPFDPDGEMLFDLQSDQVGGDFEIRISPLHGRGGGLAGWTLVARDVTETRRQAQALRDQLEVIDALRRDLAEQAVRDPLTGLHNRRYLMEFLDRHDAPALAVIDVDHFKRVNDEHGHPAGDRVLRHVAAILSAGLHPADLLARYGGEEFVLVMPGRTLDEAHAAVDGLRHRLAADPGPLPVTFSAGVATSIDAADRALYAAKRSGRDRVVGAEPVTTSPGTDRWQPGPSRPR